jgi:hypothetical protein
MKKKEMWHTCGISTANESTVSTKLRSRASYGRRAGRVPQMGDDGLEAANVGHAHVPKHIDGVVEEGEAYAVRQDLRVGNVRERDNDMLRRAANDVIIVTSSTKRPTRLRVDLASH